MRLVIVESPFAAPTPEGIERNVSYARACLADCLQRGEAPYASHLLYTQPRVLDDTKPLERELGIGAGLAWGRHAAASVVYVDLGVSGGMVRGIDDAHAHCRQVEIRRLPLMALERALGPAEAMRAAEVRPVIDSLLSNWHVRRKSGGGTCSSCGGLGVLTGSLDAAFCETCHGTGRQP